jgi:glycosyltransferase involved in cell wall biosynthesis
MRIDIKKNGSVNQGDVKKRIAVWLYGGIGTGHFSQGCPMLERLLVQLSATFEIVIYSQAAPHHDFNSLFFPIRSAPDTVKSRILRWGYLVKYFIEDHKKQKFQLLFALWGYPSGLLVTSLSKLMNLPSAVYLLGSDSASIPSIDFGILHKSIRGRLAKWAYRKTSLLFTLSRFQKDTLAIHGIDRQIHVVPVGADLSNFKFSSKPRHTILHVIHVAHLTPVKDQVTLLRAFAILIKEYPAELRIFGDDCLQGQIQKLCKELNIEKYVQFYGMIPYNQMPQQYEWADIMFHTSLSEGQSHALAEAAACGVLLAGTRVGLLYDLGDQCGITVEPGDYKDLTAKVGLILNDPEEWKNKIQRARKWCESHDLSWTVGKLTKLLHTL